MEGCDCFFNNPYAGFDVSKMTYLPFPSPWFTKIFYKLSQITKARLTVSETLYKQILRPLADLVFLLDALIEATFDTTSSVPLFIFFFSTSRASLEGFEDFNESSDLTHTGLGIGTYNRGQ